MSNELYQKIQKEAEALFLAKNPDYAGDEWSSSLNLVRLMSLEPWEGAVVRLLDKVSRLAVIRKSKNPIVKETIRDTFLDAINYSMMGLMLYDESQSSGIQPKPQTRKSGRPRSRERRKREAMNTVEPDRQQPSLPMEASSGQ